MYTKVGILLVGVALLLVSTQGGVIRPDGESKTVTTTTPRTVDAATDDVPLTTTEAVTVDIKDVEGVGVVALSRDKDATVKLAAIATLDPAPGTIDIDDEVVLLNPDGPSVGLKAEKLLLLSTPKLMERPREQEEENIEEPEEIGEAETTTTAQPDIDMTTTMASEAAAVDEKEDKPKVTKLYPINIDRALKTNAELKETGHDNGAKQQPVALSSGTTKTALEVASLIDDAPAITVQQPSEPQNDNAATAVLIETEADYVLVESDAEEFGTFTHADSDLHLQPIVESIEIVPTHVDDPLIVSYVHQW